MFEENETPESEEYTVRLHRARPPFLLSGLLQDEFQEQPGFRYSASETVGIIEEIREKENGKISRKEQENPQNP